MNPGRIKEALFQVVDSLFYPDIAQARKASNELITATQANNSGVTVRIDERWRNQIVRRELRFSLTASPQWFRNVGEDLRNLVARRDRQAIQRVMDNLARHGSVLN